MCCHQKLVKISKAVMNMTLWSTFYSRVAQLQTEEANRTEKVQNSKDYIGDCIVGVFLFDMLESKLSVGMVATGYEGCFDCTLQ